MKLLLILLLFFFTTLSRPISLREKYPDGLLTDDYGILNDADLLKEIKNGTPRPYDKTQFQPGYNRWQCFSLKNVKFGYEKWRDSDPGGPYGVIVDMCDFYFDVRQNKIRNYYHDRRARRLEYCQGVEKIWIELTKKQTHVCICGDASSTEDGETFWTWIKYKTKLGCDSLFEGECDTK